MAKRVVGPVSWSDLPERIQSKIRVDHETGCWEWTASRHRQGYGSIKWRGRTRIAHRIVYQLLVGPVPAGLVTDHLCRNTCCVNPAHLEPVTPRENLVRGDAPQMARERQLSKTHCPHGHEYTDENTRHYNGKRFCRACDRARNQTPGRRQYERDRGRRRKARA